MYGGTTVELSWQFTWLTEGLKRAEQTALDEPPEPPPPPAAWLGEAEGEASDEGAADEAGADDD